MKTYPQPGSIKFDYRLTDNEARFVAHEHYDNVQHVNRCNDTSGQYHSVMAVGRYVALIGVIGQDAMILHKRDDGSRELETAALPYEGGTKARNP